MQYALQVSNVREQFYTRRGTYKALNGVDLLLLEQGEVFGLAGESGCGKTTLGLTIIGLLPRNAAITGGEVILDGRNLVETLREYALANSSNFKPSRNEKILKKLNKELTGIRGKRISMVFQDPMTSLNPVLRVGYQVAETMVVHAPKSLAQRRLSRLRVTRSDLESIIKILKASGDEKSIISYVEEKKLQGIEEQILNVWRRKDLGEAKKEKLILSLHVEEINGIDRRILESIERTGTAPQWTRMIPFFPQSVKRLLFMEGYRRSAELLSILEVPYAEKVVMSYPHELSGGMRQRVVIAIALANDPKIIILDEPTSALDVTVQAQILDLVRHLKEKLNISFIFISHDLSVLSEVCDRIGIMYAGRIVEVAPTDEIFNNPLHPYTKLLIAAVPTLEGQEVKGIGGTVPDMRQPPTGCMFHPRCPYVMETCSKNEPQLLEAGENHQVACFLYPEVHKS